MTKRMLLARHASVAEFAALNRAYERARADFAADPKAATGLLKTGVATAAQQTIDPAVLAAMTNVASMILCLDETVTKE